MNTRQHGVPGLRPITAEESGPINDLQRRLFKTYLEWSLEQNPTGTVLGEDVLTALAAVCGELLATVPPRLRQPAMEAFGAMVVKEANRRKGDKLRGTVISWPGTA